MTVVIGGCPVLARPGQYVSSVINFNNNYGM